MNIRHLGKGFASSVPDGAFQRTDRGKREEDLSLPPLSPADDLAGQATMSQARHLAPRRRKPFTRLASP